MSAAASSTRCAALCSAASRPRCFRCAVAMPPPRRFRPPSPAPALPTCRPCSSTATTPSYTALIDRDGELIVGFADMALYDLAFPKQIRRAKVREVIAAADAVLCDANLPASALERLVALAIGRPVYAIAISPAKAVRLMPVLGCARPALHEPARGRRAGRRQRKRRGARLSSTGCGCSGLKSGVVTAGEGPVLGFDDAGAFSILPPPPRKVADVTGAGDALAGATVAALLRGLPLRAALREGVAAATLAVESRCRRPGLHRSDLQRGAGPCARRAGSGMRAANSHCWSRSPGTRLQIGDHHDPANRPPLHRHSPAGR